MSSKTRVCIVYPKSIPVTALDSQHVFLAGPIRNAPPWHEEAIDILTQMVRGNTSLPDSFYIHTPKRKVHMERSFNEDPLPTAILRTCSRQREWEFETQELAVRGEGAAGLLFWLPKQGNNEHPEKVYGAITQIEFGYWLARAAENKHLNIAFGTDGVYNGELHTLLYDIERLAPHLLPMHNSLESLCAQSVKWASEWTRRTL